LYRTLIALMFAVVLAGCAGQSVQQGPFDTSHHDKRVVHGGSVTFGMMGDQEIQNRLRCHDRRTEPSGILTVYLHRYSGFHTKTVFTELHRIVRMNIDQILAAAISKDILDTDYTREQIDQIYAEPPVTGEIYLDDFACVRR